MNLEFPWASLVDERDGGNRCAWCGAVAPAGGTYCTKRCRQTAWRLRKRMGPAAPNPNPMRVAFADPPYVGLAAKYYKGEPTFRGEVDHPALIKGLEDGMASGAIHGWALACSARSLRALLPLVTSPLHLCPIVKPIGPRKGTKGLHYTWEALIVVGGRQRPPGRRDWISCQPARLHGTLPGRKPLAYCAFLFEALGMLPGDEFQDLFPGTGMVGRSWTSLTAGGADHEGRWTSINPSKPERISVLLERSQAQPDLFPSPGKHKNLHPVAP